MVLTLKSVQTALAMASLYGPLDEHLYTRSSRTYISVQHLRDASICVINVKAINSVVAMVPDLSYGRTCQDGSKINRWFLMEKPGLKMSSMVGMDELSSQ